MPIQCSKRNTFGHNCEASSDLKKMPKSTPHGMVSKWRGHDKNQAQSSKAILKKNEDKGKKKIFDMINFVS